MNTKTSLHRNKAWQDQWFRLERNHPETEKMMDEAQRFLSHFLRRDKAYTLLVLSGRNGCGKTHLANSIARWCSRAAVALYADVRLWPHPPSLQWIEWSEICDLRANERAGLWRDCECADMLLLDDVGSETDRYRSGDATRNLADMLNARERGERYTVITTNIQRNGWRDHWDTRVADRLLRRSIIVEIHNAPSYWLQKRKER